jgi:ribose transport system permease protein
VYDLFIGGSLGFAGITCAWLQANAHWPVALSMVAALVIGIVIGCVNALLVVHFQIDSFIATLGMGSVLGGAVL